ncbi:hypothetical protein MXB_2098 [Myxobolus squamalis]|nr:hypothetical protein MXB_2098 [Myxobolus squamalis]
MTKHAYSAYMKNAYPADELLPLSCKGRYRKVGNVESYDDYSLANLSMTLIDALDTLAIMNLVDEFNHAVNLIVRDLKLDCPAYASTFEINIRVIGYKLIIFKKGDDTTCTACAGTYILEFGALSHLSKNYSYFDAAIRAINFIWISRDKKTGLIGSNINVHSGKWINSRSSIGTEIDSYFEYVFKSYVQFSSYKMLDRFENHYESISKYLKYLNMFFDLNFKNLSSLYSDSVDSLRAFFPSLQVLHGDVEEAIIYHQILHEFAKKHIFLPETFSHNYKLITHEYKQRPEFIESNYYLYSATKESFYLEIAMETVDNIEKYLRVPCGYASIKNLSTTEHSDRMETFLISELFKYLYLTFSLDQDLPIKLSDYVLSTEAHFMPYVYNKTITKTGSTNVLFVTITIAFVSSLP